MQKLYLEQLPLSSYKNLDIPIFIKNKNSQYLWANDFFIKKSLGYQNVAQIYKKEDREFSWFHYADELISNDKFLFQSEETISVTERIMRYDGTYINALSRKSPLYDTSQKVIGLIGFSIGIQKSSEINSLSKREYDALLLISAGLTDKEIAKKWNVSPRTVESYINNAKQKIKVRNRAELIAKFNRSYP